MCGRTWPAKSGGVHVCLLTAGHGGTRCIDQFHNTSHPTADTTMSRWEQALARRGASR